MRRNMKIWIISKNGEKPIQKAVKIDLNLTSSSRLSMRSCNRSFSSNVVFNAKRLFSAISFQYCELGSPVVVKSSIVTSNWDFSAPSWLDLRRLGSVSFGEVTTAVSLMPIKRRHRMSDVYKKKVDMQKSSSTQTSRYIGWWDETNEGCDTYDLDFLYKDFSPAVFTLRPTKFSLSDASFCSTFNVLRILLMFSCRKYSMAKWRLV